eukprot:TRINITY_DN29461_c0_g1_i1.p1 TRINITY_DN29461_c0_g1~~TRINITY_DN29461_c0_g1_i1.p1  ORF type:complete len:172 (-),score=53.35 TRINITY_DN29461_c0_g1_i1:98-613(-)
MRERMFHNKEVTWIVTRHFKIPRSCQKLVVGVTTVSDERQPVVELAQGGPNAELSLVVDIVVSLAQVAEDLLGEVRRKRLTALQDLVELGARGGCAALAVLADCLESDADADTRRLAVKAFTRVAEAVARDAADVVEIAEAADAALRPRLTDEDAQVRRAAEEALKVLPRP